MDDTLIFQGWVLNESPCIKSNFPPIFDAYKIFAKVPHLSIKFDEKYDGEVQERMGT